MCKTMTRNPETSAWQQPFLSAIDARLLQILNEMPWSYPDIQPSLEYALLGGGKRLRPLLLLCCLEALQQPLTLGLSAACAVEMIHVFSLIHDDLPAMDDDDMRRGRPSFHRQYGEANAILAGDLLLGLAYYHMVHMEGLPAKSHMLLLRQLADIMGPQGLVMGQWAEFNTTCADVHALQGIHHLKTAKLFEVAAVMAGCLVQADDAVQARLAAIGRQLGQCYQWLDDLEDHTEDKKQQRLSLSMMGYVTFEAGCAMLEKQLDEIDRAIDVLPHPPSLHQYVAMLRGILRALYP